MRKLNILILTLLFSLFSIAALFGQALEISGTVTESLTGNPLPGANIAVKGTNLGTASDRDGNFSMSLPNFGEATLVVTFIGYFSEEITLTQSTSDLSITMKEDVLKVSEIVVTGLATSVKRRNLANSVGTVSAKELIPVPAQTLERALNGKIAGVTVTQNTGAPGGGISINLRGTSTITGSTQPLYVVDGVIISNAAIQSGLDLITDATGAGSATPQGQPTNRIADLNPNDIANIEVLKGASAAAIYGSKASNGVVIITTKSGVAGETRIDVTQQIGFTSILNKIGARRFTAATAEAQYGQKGLDAFNANGGKFIDQEDVLFGETGFLSETTLSVRGGSERTQFYISGLVQDEDGIVKNTGYQKFSGRVNINHKISDRLKIAAYTTFARTESDRSITGNENAGTTTLGFALAFTPSFVDIEAKDENGNFVANSVAGAGSNPAESVALLKNKETVYRTINSLRLDWNLMRSENQTLDFNAIGGVDFFSAEHFVFSPNELQFERDSALPGESINGETVSIFSNLYFNATHSYTTAGNIMFRTTAGLQFENRNQNNVLVNANGLIQTQSSVDQAASIQVFQTINKQRERGFFAQEEIDWNEKIYLTGAVRGDASSANGDTEKYYLYPKASASLRLSEFMDMSSFASEFKLRVAYGETGNLPKANAKFSNLITETIGGQTGLRPATLTGDPNIKPERTKEIEMGFDATILNGNGTIEVTYYRQNIEDLILEAEVPFSSGFSAISTNAGEMRTTGWEFSLGLTPIRSKNLNWTSRINFFTTDTEITKLNVDPFGHGGFALFLGEMRVQKGFSPTAIVGAESVFNDDGTIDNILGNVNPDFNMSFNNNIKFGNFDLSFLWDWQKGGDVINLGKLLTDLGGTSADFDDEVTFTLPDGTTSTGPAGTQRLTVLGTITAPYIESASYIKLRELSLSYSLPSSMVNNMFGGQLSYLRLGVAGRNLIMIADYSGYDPEVSQFGNVVARGLDTLPFPSSRQFYFNVAFGL
ncbi:MAG: SusC/RagA family TonB-linked outer membrane protein [Caldithrix sp.]|nr:MAG: SusC/RagA family TonB-linked outer membrane protein [Caldithrix sp.]